MFCAGVTGAGLTGATGSVAGVTVVAGSVAGVTVVAGSVTGVTVVTFAVVLGSTDVPDVAALTAATAPIISPRDNVLTISVFFKLFIKIILPQTNY
ncbi:hypothetical protein [Desulfosporosinus sp.]|uniref:hypothetical protein n=1 Tax=Desulfosporosinus sp. TaxID=157907 RepID=UPI002612D37E|nr:hypothetical protein [Desulfosporosinus sp.]